MTRRHLLWASLGGLVAARPRRPTPNPPAPGPPAPTPPRAPTPPPFVLLPYVAAGGGATELDLGRYGATEGWAVEGPFRLGPGGRLRWEGSDVERIATGRRSWGGGVVSVPVFAVAGHPGLGAAARLPVTARDGAARGLALRLGMPAAPFPCEGYPWTDDTVRIFVPEGHQDRGAQDLVVHIHGWGQVVDETVALHRYEEQLWMSGANAVLVVPQGPLRARTGKFGKLLGAAGWVDLVRQVLVVLARERGLTPALGDLVLTAHSGGYQAVGAGLDPGAPPVWQVSLFDALYGRLDAYTAFSRAGGRLRSLWTDKGGTVEVNAALRGAVEGVIERPTRRALRDGGTLVVRAEADHEAVTRLGWAYSEQLRWGLRHHRQGPRLELRRLVRGQDGVEVEWLCPRDEALTGFVVEVDEGAGWRVAAEVGEERALLPAFVGRLRVRPRLRRGEGLPSDEWALGERAGLVIVAAAEGVLDDGPRGSGPLSQARVAALGPLAGAVVSKRAVEEDGLALDRWSRVLWLCGDDGPWEEPLPARARGSLERVLRKGGRVLVSGSRLGELGLDGWLADHVRNGRLDLAVEAVEPAEERARLLGRLLGG